MKFRTLIIFLGASLLAFSAPANESTTTPEPLVSPESIVQAQLDAYNRRDLEGFLGFYSEDAVLLNYPDQITQAGKAQMRARYEKRFADPNVRAEIVKRIVFDRFVIDHERITSPPAAGVIEAVATYEIKDGKIVRVTFLTK